MIGQQRLTAGKIVELKEMLEKYVGEQTDSGSQNI